MPISLSVEQAPLLITTASGILTDAEYAEHLRDCTERIVEPRQPYAYVFDGTQIQQMTSTQRKLQADWINEHREVIARLNKGCGFAFASILTRGLLTAVHWVSPPPYPYAVFASRAEAIAWCTGQLEQAGLRVPRAA